ncbi:hypothetical protein P6144_15105 [Sphingomonas sp. HITSZ_GF]|uniref:hypothetical protein n=1 Tax=Sphingomonas sp. HITSZ_GF TaxID=3037247 RepID=UPI00240E1857|nr:hypothetical protein [Sphingomonas sp. HITSZ_GF]MDG2534986.1 hypothetical protein [Sphingomonas sp. HITSZ_GF]
MEHSAAYGAGYAAGTLIGYLLFYGGILALGVFFGKRLARKRDTGFVRWPLHVAFALIVLLLMGQCAGRSGAQDVTSSAQA